MLFILNAECRWYAGCKADRLTCSNTYVYVLDTAGELLVRLAVASSNKQWHKVPGALRTIAGNGISVVRTFLASFRNVTLLFFVPVISIIITSLRRQLAGCCFCVHVYVTLTLFIAVC